MKFCDNCGNMLIPRTGKLYCKACDEEFNLNSQIQIEYNIIKTIKHDEKEIAPIIVKEGLKRDRISNQDRKAFEEFFSGGEESGY